MQRLLVTCIVAGLAGCSSGSPSLSESSSITKKKDLLAELLAYRSSAEICTSSSGQCIEWIALALECEKNLATGIAGNSCARAETYREQVSGVALSSTPGAYSF
jgi:hypothetical protein